MPICKLCKNDKNLCNQSHIIPDFMYQDLFDEDHTISEVKSDNGELQKLYDRQTGEFESNILCQDCDNEKLGDLESYASTILYQESPPSIEIKQDSNNIKYIYCDCLNYSKFKLFLLSILWRASICKREFFEEVSLGPHEDKIREMIYNKNPKDQLEYPCILTSHLTNREVSRGLITNPQQLRYDGGYAYRFIIGGLDYLFFVSQHIVKESYSNYAINPKGEINIIHLPSDTSKEIIGSMLGLSLT